MPGFHGPGSASCATLRSEAGSVDAIAGLRTARSGTPFVSNTKRQRGPRAAARSSLSLRDSPSSAAIATRWRTIFVTLGERRYWRQQFHCDAALNADPSMLRPVATPVLSGSGGPAGTDIHRLALRLAGETEGEVLFDAASRGRYATDASIYQVMPLGVFVPKTERDVAAAIDIARDLRTPVLPRGAGTSQCGQTTNAALVIDHSKHLRKVVSVDPAARTAIVQPGVVLDALNAELKRHGLWFPVDVSTSAQATLGGMAGNNSCGSRSIAYGNMVHNVIGVHLRLADGAALHAGPVGSLGGRAADTARFVRTLADSCRSEIEAHWPRVMRRVAGYNLDIFQPRSERPYTHDGSVNLAHLFVGAEGTLGFIEALDLQLTPLPRAKVLGVVNFASFHRAMDCAQHIVKLGPTAVELVDRTMIEL